MLKVWNRKTWYLKHSTVHYGNVHKSYSNILPTSDELKEKLIISFFEASQLQRLLTKVKHNSVIWKATWQCAGKITQISTSGQNASALNPQAICLPISMWDLRLMVGHLLPKESMLQCDISNWKMVLQSMATGMERFGSLHALPWFPFLRKGLHLQSGDKLISRCKRCTAMRWAVNFQNSSFVSWTGKPTRSQLTTIHHGM